MSKMTPEEHAIYNDADVFPSDVVTQMRLYEYESSDPGPLLIGEWADEIARLRRGLKVIVETSRCDHAAAIASGYLRNNERGSET